jgi:hypothetical protein
MLVYIIFIHSTEVKLLFMTYLITLYIPSFGFIILEERGGKDISILDN